MLTNEEITARVEIAFLPLRCIAEVWDYGQKLRFQVLDANDKNVLRLRSLVLERLRDEKQLEQMLQLARSRVRAKGFTFQRTTRPEETR